jgi:hypothetical protein
LGSGGILALNIYQGLGNDVTATTVGAPPVTALPTTLVLPVGAVVIFAVVTNNGVNVTSGGMPTYDIGTSINAITASTNIFNTMTLISLNSSALSYTASAPAGLLPLAVDGARLVTVRATSAANTAGDLKIVIEYIQL